MIDADFRTILKIIDLYEDEDIIDALKYERLLAWFYKGAPPDMENSILMMFSFISGYARVVKSEPLSKPEYDYGFDADVIYSSFIKEYSVDLIEAPFLHWYKFQMMLAGLSSESAFNRRLRIRTFDLTGLKGKDLVKVKKAKEAVQIPVRAIAEDAESRKEFVEKWG